MVRSLWNQSGRRGKGLTRKGSRIKDWTSNRR